MFRGVAFAGRRAADDAGGGEFALVATVVVGVVADGFVNEFARFGVAACIPDAASG